MAYKENPREAKQIEIHEGLLIQPDKGTGRGRGWLPDALLDTRALQAVADLVGIRVELKTGQRDILTDGSYGAGSISTTREWKLSCIDNGAYSPDVHWIISFYKKEDDGFILYEHWYCAPGWLSDWQDKQKDNHLKNFTKEYKPVIDYLDEDLRRGYRTEEEVSNVKNFLLEKYRLNDPKISSTDIEDNPLCVQYDGTKNGLLNAIREVKQ